MPTPSEWQRRQRRIVLAASGRLLSLWRQTDPNRIGPSWDLLTGRAVTIVAAAQTAAAVGAAGYVDDTIGPSMSTPAPNPSRLAGVASDGRPLDTLMSLPGSRAGRLAGAGMSVPAARSAGANMLVGLAATQIYDAGRQAVGIAIVAQPEAGGYRRQLRGATNCARCVVLAGKWFRWNSGFRRHPRCDCVHVPSAGPASSYSGTAGFDPQTYFSQLDETTQDRVFTRAGAQAIRDGADIGQVVNARRGMRTTTQYGRKVVTTTSGAGTAPIRLMPEQIYRDAHDRDDAVRLLQLHGFL